MNRSLRMGGVLLIASCLNPTMHRFPDRRDRLARAAFVHSGQQQQPDYVSFCNPARGEPAPAGDYAVFCTAKSNKQCEVIRDPDLMNLCRAAAAPKYCSDITDPGLQQFCKFSHPKFSRGSFECGGDCEGVKTSKYYGLCNEARATCSRGSSDGPMCGPGYHMGSTPGQGPNSPAGMGCVRD